MAAQKWVAIFFWAKVLIKPAHFGSMASKLIKGNQPGRGGPRKGAGRKAGSLTKRTREIAEKAIATGRTPLEIMLENMRHFQKVALDAEATIDGLTAEEFTGREMSPQDQFKELLAKAKAAAGLRQMAQECARDAARYMHAPIASTEATINLKGELTIRATKEQRDAAVSAALRADL